MSSNNNVKHNQSVFVSVNGPKIEIMPSGVPQSFYMKPSKYHDAQLRASLVELKITLQQLSHQPMSSDAASLMEFAAKEIKQNRAILSGNIDTTSSMHNSSFGVTITGTSPQISMSRLATPELKFPSPVLDSNDISIDNIDWEL